MRHVIFTQTLYSHESQNNGDILGLLKIESVPKRKFTVECIYMKCVRHWVPAPTPPKNVYINKIIKITNPNN